MCSLADMITHQAVNERRRLLDHSQINEHH